MPPRTLFVAAALAWVVLLPQAVDADQPKLGFNGTLVRLTGEHEPFFGFRVDSISPGWPAQRIQELEQK